MHEVRDINHTHLIVSAAGVWQLEPEMFILCAPVTGGEAVREGAGHTHNNTILFLKDAHSQ